MRTFEFSDGRSDKFWNIDLQGNRYTVTFGRAGTAGQTQTKQFADAAKAQAAHDRLIAEKLAKGYRETTAAAPAAPARRRLPEKAPQPEPSPTQRALEEALAKNPDDWVAHAAYADYRTEQGDPRGELIQVQLALEDPGCSPAERKKLQQREQALLQQHQREWLDELAPYLLDGPDTVDARYATYQAYQFQFARGWLDTLEVGMLSVPFARLLARAPQTRLLRRLVVKETQFAEEDAEDEVSEPSPDVPEDAYWPGLFPLLKSPYLGNVRVLQLGERVEDWPFEQVGMSGEGAAKLVGKMPALEELYLLAHAVDLEALFRLKTLTALRVLQIYHVEHEYPLAALARNAALGRLTHLLLHPHGYSGSERGSYLPLEEVRALVHSPHLKSLTHLRLRLSNMGDAGCREIVRSGILKRLKVLDLRYGEITDEGARTLAASPDLRSLESLDVGVNWLTADGINALKAVGIKVQAEGQYTMGEDGYLMEGDME